VKVYGSLVKLVAFMVITTVLTIVLAQTINNAGVGNTQTYHARFTDVTGLNAGDDVRVAGVKVGQVKHIQLVDRRYADVTLAVQKNITVRTSTVAAVRYLNLVGQRYVALIDQAPKDGTTAQALPAGGLIPLSNTRPPLDLTLLFNGFKPLFTALTPADVNKVSLEIVRVLQGEGGTIDQLLQHTASLTTTIANRDKVVGDVINNLDKVLTTVDDRNQGLSDLVLQLQRLVSNLSGDRNSIGDSIVNIDHLAGSTASLLKGIRPSLKPDIAKLRKISHTLATVKDTNGQNFLDGVLQRLPGKVTAILRTATYGSWFNFYLCDFQVEGVNLRGFSDVPSCDQP
jgi:phospholipid/cholesterol/gamma-HCH transport system substrate-binding protein